ncbi:MAG TPA: LytTR family DNA-binding domain-containing protein [Kofleriaceae bacterium]|nr:LytTR family DNA-binding domain-containing protein [Kofleriaceae bacterium]
MSRAEWGVVVADDEPAARRGVRQLLAGFPAFAVVAECRTGAEVLDSLDRLAPDAVFLDIQMPGIGGFEVIGRRTPERMPAVVFLTAWDQFALRAFEAQALDYLVKPVAEARFAATMARLTRQLASAAPARREPSIVVSSARGSTVLPLSEIDWIESADNYARLWIGPRSYLVRESMDALEERVRGHGFARAHRSALVRLDGVRQLAWRGGGLSAVLAAGPSIPVSRRRRAAFAAAVRARGI